MGNHAAASAIAIVWYSVFEHISSSEHLTCFCLQKRSKFRWNFVWSCLRALLLNLEHSLILMVLQHFILLTVFLWTLFFFFFVVSVSALLFDKIIQIEKKICERNTELKQTIWMEKQHSVQKINKAQFLFGSFSNKMFYSFTLICVNESNMAQYLIY